MTLQPSKPTTNKTLLSERNKINTAVFRESLFCIAGGERFFLTITDNGHALGVDAQTDEITLHRFRAALLGISVDGVWCHLAFAKDRKLHFPLLADFEPKGAVARDYGVYRSHEGICERAIFVIDSEGIIRSSYVSPIGVNPGADVILTALEGLPTTEVPNS